jgi:hypothetical protein
MKLSWTRSLAMTLMIAIAGPAVGCEKNNTDGAGPEGGTATTAAATATDTTTDTAATTAATTAAKKDDDAFAGGKTVSSDLYDVQFQVPEDWKILEEKEGITATAPDGTTTVLLIGSDSKGLIKATFEDIKKTITLKDPNFQDIKNTVVDGMPAQHARGSAVLEKKDMDQEIQFIAYAIQKGGKTVTLMVFSEAEMYEAQKELIEGIARSLKQA